MDTNDLQKKYDENWEELYTEVEEGTIQKDSNVIKLHVMFKVKTEHQGQKRLNSHICQHGNRDDPK